MDTIMEWEDSQGSQDLVQEPMEWEDIPSQDSGNGIESCHNCQSMKLIYFIIIWFLIKNE